MARIQAVLAVVVTAVRRDLQSIGSFSGNNLFVLSVAFLFLGDPGAFGALSGFIGLILFVPLSADPLRVVPPDRLALWPLANTERYCLRIVTPWLNPSMWAIAALALWKHLSAGLWALACGVLIAGFVLPSLPAVRKGVWHRLPHFPGPLDQLIRKNLRELLSTLDFWGAAVLSAACLAFRCAGLLPKDALLPMTIVAMLAISTYTQTLFGLDGEGGMTRYALLPVAGWQILVAKDLPFLLASVLLTAPMSPVGGLAAAFVTLAVGRHGSLSSHNNQIRWRFSSGVNFATSILQIVVTVGAAAAAYDHPILLAPCAAIYAASTWWYSRRICERFS